MPREFSLPKIKIYDKTIDLDYHVAMFKMRMLISSVLFQTKETYMCEEFVASLGGPTLQWYISLFTNSIYTVAQLADLFVQQFASSKKIEKQTDNLYQNQIEEG